MSQKTKKLNFPEVIEYLYQNNQETLFRNPELKLQKTRHLLHLLGNPQEKTRVIHVAGTTGKGSVCNYTANILQINGFKVGLHTSPHFTDIRERFLVDGKILNKDIFLEYVQAIWQADQEMKASYWGQISYMQRLVCLAYYIFAKENVDYAVIETACGGINDHTNIVDKKDKLCIINKIGLDHIPLLGTTIQEIAMQKIGIAKTGNYCIINKPENEIVKHVFEEYLHKDNIDFEYFENGNIYNKNTYFSFQNKSFEFLNLPSPKAKYQTQNICLSLQAIQYLSKRDDFEIHTTKVAQAIKNTKIIGRFETINYKNAKIILDSAHNPQKMQGLIDSLNKEQNYNFLLTFKDGKNFKKLIDMILPYTSNIVLTTTKMHTINFVNPEEIKNYLLSKNFRNIEIESDVETALDRLVSHKQNLIITGSMYFIGSLLKLINKD